MSFLKNETLVLTGASSGIGRALALRLADEGVKLVLNARTESRLHDICAQCRELGVEAEYVAGDASDPAVMRQVVQKALELGDFFGFIHAAGVLRPGPNVWELDSGAFAEVMGASVTAAHSLMRQAVPFLRDRGEGLCVFFGSGAADRAQPGIGAYCAAKAAEEHLARQLAAEAPELLTIIWRPGIVETDMQVQARRSEGGAARELQSVFRPWKEKGMLLTPEESAAGLVDFLLGEPEAYQGKVADIREV